jgi:hypothetical protein
MRSNEDKLELFADLLEPAAAIIADKAWAQEWQAGNRAGAIKAAIRGHKKEIIEILARIEGKDPEKYQIDGLGLFIKLAAMFNRPDIEMVDGLFTAQGQTDESASSGSATGNIEDGAK